MLSASYVVSVLCCMCLMSSASCVTSVLCCLCLMLPVACRAELQDDWSSKSPPDLCHFVPYVVDIGLSLHQFELVTLTNEYNWVDCSSKNMSNGASL